MVTDEAAVAALDLAWPAMTLTEHSAVTLADRAGDTVASSADDVLHALAGNPEAVGDLLQGRASTAELFDQRVTFRACRHRI